jgi:hypothetical protein
LNIGAENIELCFASFHTGSEGVARSECCQLGKAVWEKLSAGDPGELVGGWPDRLRGGAP